MVVKFQRDDINAMLYVFPEYGKDFIKNQKIHPDAYIQCALQFAYYKLHNKYVVKNN